MTPVYLDYAASAPLAESVLEAMRPWLTRHHGNPSSVHAAGRAARNAVEEARDTVARLLGATSEEIVFTSGGTEANYLAAQGVTGLRAAFCPPTEHDAVLGALGSLPFPVHGLAVDEDGRCDPDVLAPLDLQDALVSVMLVNNELGTVNPVPEIAAHVREAGGWTHSDAVQAPVWMMPRTDRLGVDLMTLSAHKFGGPKGAGLLFVRTGTPFAAPMVGGGQERDRRGGTENVAAIVGMAAALEKQEARGRGRADRLRALRLRLKSGLVEALGDRVAFNGPAEGGAPQILNVRVSGVSPGGGSEMLILGLDLEGIQVSAGSACSSGALHASHVLTAIGQGQDAAIRFSLGHETTDSDIDRAVVATAKVVGRVLAVA